MSPPACSGDCSDRSRAGWSTVAQGVKDQPNTFHFGAAGGGVWKTTDAGATWHPVFDSVNAANIGALAVAPGDANGWFMPAPARSLRATTSASGDGVYKSTDAGKSWQPSVWKRRVRSARSRSIRAMRTRCWPPRSVMYSAAIRNAVCSVLADGGKTWTRTLFVDDATGAVDLAINPGNPDVVFASVWRARYWPWLHYFMSEESTQSGVYKSTDAGRTWQRISAGGWPAAKLGRIGLAATHAAGATRIYAAVASEEAGGLYRSDDGGAHWQYVNHDKGLANGYFGQAHRGARRCRTSCS